MVSLLSSKILRCIIALIRIYQRISQLINPHCRFYPTCSEYSIKALYRFGLIIGSWLTIKRLLKCHPLNSGGKDPVPSTFKKFNTKEY